MAFTTLTNPKTIMSLGPGRSILGTIIRPDSLLVERKGGLTGQVTFNSLLPGAGEPLESQPGKHDLLCNWQVDEEDPLPRGGGGDGKKRKSAEKSKSRKKKKEKENGTDGAPGSSKSGSRKDKSAKKNKRRGDPNVYGRSVSPW